MFLSSREKGSPGTKVRRNEIINNEVKKETEKEGEGPIH